MRTIQESVINTWLRCASWRRWSFPWHYKVKYFWDRFPQQQGFEANPALFWRTLVAGLGAPKAINPSSFCPLVHAVVFLHDTSTLTTVGTRFKHCLRLPPALSAFPAPPLHGRPSYSCHTAHCMAGGRYTVVTDMP